MVVFCVVVIDEVSVCNCVDVVTIGVVIIGVVAVCVPLNRVVVIGVVVFGVVSVWVNGIHSSGV